MDKKFFSNQEPLQRLAIQLECYSLGTGGDTPGTSPSIFAVDNERTIIKEIEQNQLTWYGHVQRMADERLSKIALKWMPKQNRARGRPKKNRMEGIKQAMNERNLNEGQ